VNDDRAARLLDQLGAREGGVCFIVPGRIEVLGKHTDYAGGRSLLCATVRGFAAAAAPRGDGRVRVADARSRQHVDLDAGPQTRGMPRWSVYPRTVLERARSDFGTPIPGCDILLDSDLPSAAGISSSSALITAVFLALDAVAALSASPRYQTAIRSREDLAAYLAAVERGTPFAGLGSDAAGVDAAGIGTRGGGEDHTAILCAEPGRLVRYAFEPTRREGTVPVPDGLTFAVASSGVRAPKAGVARDRYNRLSDLATHAAALWRSATGGDEPHLGAIAEAGPDALARLHDVLWCRRDPASRDALRARVRHFVAESEEIVPAACDALAARDLRRFGEVVDRSQALADRLLGNQVPQTRWLAAEARRRGAAAASAFGAGFGGSVWALVPRDSAPEFLRGWRHAYERQAGRRRLAAFFHTPAAYPARRGPGKSPGPGG
jgi:galactokinase